ncbi:MAG: hypothetical protein NZ899_00230 [Thermoguttaceae bacterium]|nr:hypothetical protein [Thermoguttaceae bacterium]MDW8077323.1 hypothetical protein [Thermoguttaceae bacterium]
MKFPPPQAWRRGRRLVRTILTVFVTTFFLGALLAILALWVILRAIAYVPDFYRIGLSVPDSQLAPIYDKFVDRVSASVAQLKKNKAIEAVLPEDELNAWLTIQGPRWWRGETPVTIRSPRVRLGDKKIWLGAQVEMRWLKGVLWFAVEPEVRGPNVVAVRIEEARLGRVPIPTDRLARLVVSGYLTETVGPHRVTPYWEMGADGRPILVLHLDVTPDPNSPDRIQVDGFRVGEGAVAISLRIVRPPK